MQGSLVTQPGAQPGVVVYFGGPEGGPDVVKDDKKDGPPRLNSNDGPPEDLFLGATELRNVADQSQIAVVHNPRTDETPETWEFKFRGRDVKCIGLPSKGCVDRLLCCQLFPSEYKRVNGGVAIVAASSILVGSIYLIQRGAHLLEASTNAPVTYAPTANGTVVNETVINGTVINGTFVPTGSMSNPTSAPLAYTGPTFQNDLNLLILIFAIVGACWGIYQGFAGLLCNSREELPRRIPV